MEAGTHAASMIPSLDHNGVLPPFLHGDPTHAANRSPYRCDILEFAQAFCTTAARQKILVGLLSYRDWLRSVAQVTQAVQWFDGSFVEDCENTLGKAPKDLDVATFYMRPATFPTQADWYAFFTANKDHFDPDWLKSNMGCDAYVIQIDWQPFWTLQYTHYWYGLFSHQRATRIWKGIVEVNLLSNDGDASAFVSSVIFP